MNKEQLLSSEIRKIENRLAARKALFCKVLLKQQDGHIHTAKTCDISIGGMAIIAEFNPPSGHVYALQFSVQPAGEAPHLLQLQAQVMHSILAKDGFRVGLRFVTPDAQAKALIQRFVDS
ncbi:MAG TPA: PilZ domain-containing protein [Rhodocyclaceae bacterium]|jgi:hypothetical protein|nr:PilZ domain-containing protein [Rhodocyclaceae bacterium]